MKDQIEKQAIEEMAQDLNMLDTLQCDFRYSVNYQRAKGLYSLGYRKQSDGKWIFKRTYYEADECNCSVCGQLMTTAKGVRMNYCPNCGAKMKGGAE